MKIHRDVIQDSAGNVRAGVPVEVRISGTSTRAILFADADGMIPKANPFVTDAFGGVQYAVADGLYDQVIGSGTGAETIERVEVVDALAVSALALDASEAATDAVTQASGAKDRANHTGTQPASSVAFAGRPLDKKLTELAVSVHDIPNCCSPDGTIDPAILRAAFASGIRHIIAPLNQQYTLAGRLTLDTAGSIFALGIGTQIFADFIWDADVGQNPANWGNAIHVTAHDCAIIGAGPMQSKIYLPGQTDANMIGFLNATRGVVQGLYIDGVMADKVAKEQDTFFSGIHILNHPGNPGAAPGKYLLRDVEIANFIQYGLNLYGGYVQNMLVDNVDIHDIGKPGDDLSIGDGVAVNKWNNHIVFRGGSYSNCKRNGIFQTSAGGTIHDISYDNIDAHSNGACGLLLIEQGDLVGAEDMAASLANNTPFGQRDIRITNCRASGNTEEGVRIGVYERVPWDGVSTGFIKDVLIEGLTAKGNRAGAVVHQAVDDATRRAENIIINNSTLADNNERGAVVSPYARVTGDNNLITGNALEPIYAPGYVPFTNTRYARGQVTRGSGVFVPTIKGEITAGVPVYDIREATWRMNDNILTIDMMVQCDCGANLGAGDCFIEGLPFPVAQRAAGPIFATQFEYQNGFAPPPGTPQWAVIEGETKLRLGLSDAAARPAAYANMPMPKKAAFRITARFKVNT